jgi:drug/metabolite transporter (DMT)-like permease
MSGKLISFAVWFLFFASSVIGHVAFKRGAGTNSSLDFKSGTSVFFSSWGILGLLSWAASCWLWAVLLTRYSLFSASSISAIRYVAICGCSMLVLKEWVGPREMLGAALIVAGIFLVAK